MTRFSKDCPETYHNLICLCPNHHTLFDIGGFTIEDDLTLIGIVGSLHMHPTHTLSSVRAKYHREHYSPKR